MNDTNQRFGRVADVISAEHGSETILLKLPAAAYYGLDEVGSLVWKMLATPCLSVDIARLVSAEFGVPLQTATDDVQAFLNELMQEGLTETRGDEAERGPVPVSEVSQAQPAVAGRRYSAPSIERGLLRNAAHTSMGSHHDGGTACQYKIS